MFAVFKKFDTGFLLWKENFRLGFAVILRDEDGKCLLRKTEVPVFAAVLVYAVKRERLMLGCHKGEF